MKTAPQTFVARDWEEKWEKWGKVKSGKKWGQSSILTVAEKFKN
jgi:hypothetical protein